MRIYNGRIGVWRKKLIDIRMHWLVQRMNSYNLDSKSKNWKIDNSVEYRYVAGSVLIIISIIKSYLSRERNLSQQFNYEFYFYTIIFIFSNDRCITVCINPTPTLSKLAEAPKLRVSRYIYNIFWMDLPQRVCTPNVYVYVLLYYRIFSCKQVCHNLV